MIGDSLGTRACAVLFGAVLFLTAASEDLRAASQRFVVMGTGGVSGVYFPAGGALCRVVNAVRKMHGVRCSVEATPGSVHNVSAVLDGDLDIGIVQSDVHFLAATNAAPFKTVNTSGLRALFSLHNEAFTIVARQGSGIHGLLDLAGRKVNIGNPGSGQRNAMEMVMAVLGWTTETFASVEELPSRTQAQALCDGRVDAIVFMAGHPNASIREALRGCDGYLVPIDEESTAAILKAYSYMNATAIDGSAYGLDGAPVQSFGVVATVVTTNRLDEKTVYAIVDAVFSDLDGVRVQHEALSGLDASRMATLGSSAPLHDGARRYFRDAGLVTD